VFIATLIKLATRKSPYDLLKTTLKNMTFKVGNHFGTEGVTITQTSFLNHQKLFINCKICDPLIKSFNEQKITYQLAEREIELLKLH